MQPGFSRLRDDGRIRVSVVSLRDYPRVEMHRDITVFEQGLQATRLRRGATHHRDGERVLPPQLEALDQWVEGGALTVRRTRLFHGAFEVVVRRLSKAKWLLFRELEALQPLPLTAHQTGGAAQYSTFVELPLDV